MKTKQSIPKKGRQLESVKVEPSRPPVAQANEEDLGIDLKELGMLFEMNDILRKLYRNPSPSPIDCEDEAARAYRKACALLTYAEYADVGLDAEHSMLAEPIARYVMDSVQLQLDIVRLASKRLFSLCDARDRAEVQTKAA